MKILMTGSGGHVGSVLKWCYAQDGVQVQEFDPSFLMPGPHRVLHLAAKRPTATPEEIIQSNIGYLNDIVSRSLKTQIDELIFFSTQSIYKNYHKPHVAEEVTLIDPDLYTLSKFIGERILSASPIKRVLCLRLPGILEINRSTTFLSNVFDQLKLGATVFLRNSHQKFNAFISIPDLYSFLKKVELKQGCDILNMAARPERTLWEITHFLKDKLGSRSEIVSQGAEGTFYNVSIEKLTRNYSFVPAPVDTMLAQWVEARLFSNAATTTQR